ncbi:MAG TPA: hypothetical protein VGC11_09435 [Acidimicrobiia bacterium]|jgi:hypothetical protein
MYEAVTVVTNKLPAPWRREEGFQTAEAIGIAAVGLLVLLAIWGVLEVLGVDVINWIRDTFGVPSS